MKKIYIIAAFAACALGMNAQLKVLKSGNVRIGRAEAYSSIVNPPVQKAVSLFVETDSLASLNLLRDEPNGAGAYITFGNLRKVGIGEYSATNPITDSDILQLFGERGLIYSAGNKSVFTYSTSGTASAYFTFNCSLKANSFVTTSDARMKKDVKGIDGISSVLGEIAPVSYRLTDSGESLKASAADDGTLVPMNPDDRVKYGFVAQEVKEILPELVVEDADGYLGIDYLGFIPILVDACKKLEARVNEQDEIIATLTGGNMRKSPTAGVDGLLAGGKATLLQNKPNPFKESTAIECVVPEGSSDAFICVYDLQGSQVKRFDINERGNCSVIIDGSSLKPGMYIYTLIIDGREIDSKKMILTD